MSKNPPPPHSLEHERALIGAVLLDPARFAQAHALLGGPTAFYSDTHRHIWRAIEAVQSRGVDVDMMTVGAELRTRGVLDAAGRTEGLAKLIDDVPSVMGASNYAREVRRLASLRDGFGFLKDALREVAAIPEDPAAFFQTCATAFADLARGTVDTKRTSHGDAVDRVIARLCEEERRSGFITSGIPAFDKRTGGGYMRGVLNVVGARPSTGKSTWLGQNAIAAAMHASHAARIK